MLVNNAFGGRRYVLTVIDAGHWLAVLVLMGVVIGWMGVVTARAPKCDNAHLVPHQSGVA